MSSTLKINTENVTQCQGGGVFFYNLERVDLILHIDASTSLKHGDEVCLHIWHLTNLTKTTFIMLYTCITLFMA